jgi:hypothetical protein
MPRSRRPIRVEPLTDPATNVETSEQPGARPGGDSRRGVGDGGGQRLEVATDETPEKNWSREKLAWYATRVEERARCTAHRESGERFRLGMALHFAHQQTPWGQWDAWVDKTFTFTRMTAWRAEQLYLRATEKYGERAEEACGSQSITDLYIGLRIKKKDEWLNEGDGDEVAGQPKPQGAQQSTATRRQAKKRRRARGTLPDDPRRHAEESCKQEYPTDGLILMAADCLYDGMTRFETMPNDEKAIRLALVTLEQIKDHADRLIRLCEAQREASR